MVTDASGELAGSLGGLLVSVRANPKQTSELLVLYVQPLVTTYVSDYETAVRPELPGCSPESLAKTPASPLDRDGSTRRHSR
jgi:hypothetical protein